MADLLRKYKSLYSSTTNSFSTGTSETITPASVTGLPTTTEIVLTFGRVDSSGTKTPSLMERIIGTISGGNLVVRTSPASGRGADGSTEQAHTTPVVEMIWNAKDWNDLIDAFLTAHTQAGAHGSLGNASATSLTVTNNITACDIAASDITATSLTVRENIDVADGKAIRDANDNEILEFGQTASAVNQAKLTNAAIGGGPLLEATGETNVNFELKPKGSGVIQMPRKAVIQVVAPGSDTASGNGKFFLRVPEELNGFNLNSVAACVSTAGTASGTTNVQLRRTRSACDVDMLSTALTIDADGVDSSTAATPAVVDAAQDDVNTGDQINVDVDGLTTETVAKGLVVQLGFVKP